MKVFISPSAQQQIDDPEIYPFIRSAIIEMMRFGSDDVKHERNPFYAHATSVLWWDKSSSLAIYHDKSNDYTLLFENPRRPRTPIISDGFLVELLAHSEQTYLT